MGSNYKKNRMASFKTLISITILALLCNIGLTMIKMKYSNELIRLPQHTLSAVLDNEGYSADAFYREVRSLYSGKVLVRWEDYLFSDRLFLEKGDLTKVSRINNPLDLTKGEYSEAVERLESHRVFVYNTSYGQDSNTNTINTLDWRPYDVVLIAPDVQDNALEAVYEVRCREMHLLFFIPDSKLPERLREQL